MQNPHCPLNSDASSASDVSDSTDCSDRSYTISNVTSSSCKSSSNASSQSSCRSCNTCGSSDVSSSTGSCRPCKMRLDSSRHVKHATHSTDKAVSVVRQYFEAMVTPMNDVRGALTQDGGLIRFQIRRWNKTVTLQWEPFSGLMAAGGRDRLEVRQTLYNLPPHAIDHTIHIKVGGNSRFGILRVLPRYPKTLSNIEFIISTINDIKLDDYIEIPGGAVTWIIDGDNEESDK